jgi:hypothetical protein
MWEQYIRDLVVFGCNAIEIIPPRSDDDSDSPLFPDPPLRTMAAVSRIADAYGLDVWIWYRPWIKTMAILARSARHWTNGARFSPRSRE